MGEIFMPLLKDVFIIIFFYFFFSSRSPRNRWPPSLSCIRNAANSDDIRNKKSKVLHISKYGARLTGGVIVVLLNH